MESDLETERRAQILMLRTSHARLFRKSKAMLVAVVNEPKVLEVGSPAWTASIELGAALLGAGSAEQWHTEIVEKTSAAVKGEL